MHTGQIWGSFKHNVWSLKVSSFTQKIPIYRKGGKKKKERIKDSHHNPISSLGLCLCLVSKSVNMNESIKLNKNYHFLFKHKSKIFYWRKREKERIDISSMY